MLAYIAAVTAHPGFTRRFREQLRQPGVRVPLTSDPALWNRGITLGREILWLHTYERPDGATPRQAPFVSSRRLHADVLESGPHRGVPGPAVRPDRMRATTSEPGKASGRNMRGAADQRRRSRSGRSAPGTGDGDESAQGASSGRSALRAGLTSAVLVLAPRPLRPRWGGR
ncbi:hypothetical protein K1Y72_17980 [Actinomadura sp. PM05-2]|uniref:Type ISP restriction-modification enzyme LLaBIII C-terminal specificity domain-containing protein n=2 Tax=Actinomadura parmotrematis TaxID=2864039 RepID=A0ABS7FV39_9ACTN|nr:hypothetical protein [Actinomadura parmotrematis]